MIENFGDNTLDIVLIEVIIGATAGTLSEIIIINFAVGVQINIIKWRLESIISDITVLDILYVYYGDDINYN